MDHRTERPERGVHPALRPAARSSSDTSWDRALAIRQLYVGKYTKGLEFLACV